MVFIQRFNSGLGLNLHFHMACLDGVYAAAPDGQPEFHELAPPENEEVLDVVSRIAARVAGLIESRGLEEEADPLSANDPGLAALYAAAVRGRVALGPNTGNRVASFGGDRIDGDSLDALSSPRCAGVDGFNLHANVSIGARDRERLERLLRYAARPAVCLQRLSRLPDGRLSYRLKRIWSDGTTDVIFEPLDFIGKLAALVPPPRVHLTRFFGILGPAAKWRSSIIPATSGESDSPAAFLAAAPPVDAIACQPSVETELVAMSNASRNYTWAYLMMLVFLLDVLQCPNCGGRLRFVAAIQPPDTTRKILDCLGLPSRPPPVKPAVPATLPDYF